MNVNSPWKQQRTSGACPLSLTAYENTHGIDSSNSYADIPSTISGFSAPAPPPLLARAASPPEWTLISFSLENSKLQLQSLPQSHSSQLLMPLLMMIVPPSPSSTSNQHQHLLRQRHTQLPGHGLCLSRTSASSCSIKLATLDDIFSRSAAQPPPIIDHLACS